MWRVRFYCRTELNYNGKAHKVGEEWIPAGLLNDEKIMYNDLLVKPKYSKIVRRKPKAPEVTESPPAETEEGD